MLAKKGLVYFKVAVDQELQNFGGKTCGTMGVDTNKEYCVDATGSSFVLKDQSSCTTAGLTSSALTMESLTYTLADYKQVTRAFNDGVPSGVGVFTTEDPPKQ